MALTQLEIKNVKEGMHADGGGLYLSVSSGGTKSWIFRYTINNKRREMGIGSLSATPATEARKRIAELRDMVGRGIDPIQARDTEKAKKRAIKKAEEITFDVVAADYIEAHRPSWDNPKHIQQWENTLSTYVFPVFGATPIDKIDVDLVLKALTPIWNTKAETASRIRGRIEKILTYAKGMKYRSGENPAMWRGNLEALLPANSKVKRTEHYPALPFHNIKEFMIELRERQGMAARCLELVILTVSRSGSAREAEFSEFDIDSKIWEIPNAHMKKRKRLKTPKHRVPLSNAVIKIIKEIPRMAFTTLVFPSPRKLTPMSDNALNKVIELVNDDREKKGQPRWIDPNSGREITTHGFRSTFRDWAAETTLYPHEMQEIALAHIQDDQTEAAYRRGDMLEKRRQMMEDWAAYCESSTSSNVVSIKKASK